MISFIAKLRLLYSSVVMANVQKIEFQYTCIVYV
jgi:hypothetical protein